jgi:putative heme-binding domain-containing protein
MFKMASLDRIALAAVCILGIICPGARAQEGSATPVEKLSLLPGFKAELLYSVPRSSEGSWVNMTVDPKGRLITSAQDGLLYRVTPPAIGSSQETRVEAIDLKIGQAHGLLHAFGSLYVVVNGKAAQGSGLYRVRDTNGDDTYDEVTLLRLISGGGEHGPHAVVLSPDGKSLLVMGGNHTKIPDPETTRLPRNWGEDQLLPRQWDANGHARGVLAPGGWVCQTDPEGKSWDMICSGFRNQFDIAVNGAGDVFTYDADMEWDIGTPWYRPTRVCQVVSGGEFGWRSGTGKWPDYYPDSLPAVVNIGPGSPTGIAFGTGARFPAKYQNALFICDWSFGKLYAVHMTPNGATYSGEVETFATATPLPLTDVVVNPKDGALYFTIGGRNTQSGLYRVTYVGGESTKMAQAPKTTDTAKIRKELESLHHRDARGVEKAWPYLGHSDRFVRYAARIAVENQPVSEWRGRVLQESNPKALVTALLALARQGESSDQDSIFEGLGRLDPEAISEQEVLSSLRVLALSMIRMGRPENDFIESASEILSGMYPAKSNLVNRELAGILVYFQAPGIVGRTLRLMTESPSQQEQIHYALVLRNLKSGWTLDQRRVYFSWFVQAQKYKGGASFKRFIQNIKDEAVDLLSESEKLALADVLEGKNLQDVALNYDMNRKFVKEYTTEELVKEIEKGLSGRDFNHGKKMFATVACYGCHYFSGEGGSAGPDLTGVSGRFNAHDLIESIVAPSRTISDQYQSTIFELKDGSDVTGRVANLAGDNLMVVTDMMAPGDFTNIAREKIESTRPSSVSPMPEGLLNSLSLEEIKDLVAYLLSGGDSGSKLFRK